MKDLHNAFPPTPERVEDAIYEGVRRARRRENDRAHTILPYPARVRADNEYIYST